MRSFRDPTRCESFVVPGYQDLANNRTSLNFVTWPQRGGISDPTTYWPPARGRSVNSARYCLESSIEPDNSRKTRFSSLCSRIVGNPSLGQGGKAKMAQVSTRPEGGPLPYRGKALSDGIRTPETVGCKGQTPTPRPPVSAASLRYLASRQLA